MKPLSRFSPIQKGRSDSSGNLRHRRSGPKVQRRSLFVALILCLTSLSLKAEAEDFDLEVDFFIAVDCPIANAYAPEINRLYQQFGSDRVRFRLVYPETTLQKSDVEAHRKEFELKPEGVIDTDHALVERAGATVTPEVAVFDRTGTLRYRGKIDNLYVDYGAKRRFATRKHLKNALRQLLAGEPFEFLEVEAIGCFIEPLPNS